MKFSIVLKVEQGQSTVTYGCNCSIITSDEQLPILRGHDRSTKGHRKVPLGQEVTSRMGVIGG